MSNLSTLAERYIVYAGFNDTNLAAGVPTVGMYWRYSDDINGGFWQGVCEDGGTEAILNSVIAPSTTLFQRLGCHLNQARTLATFYIDGVSIGTISTFLPITTNAAAPGFKIEKTIGGGNRLLHTDYIYVNLAISR